MYKVLLIPSIFWKQCDTKVVCLGKCDNVEKTNPVDEMK